MPNRTFRDASGREWMVWDVVPHTTDRRDGADRQELAGSNDDGRVATRPTSPLPRAYAEGWLCFEHGSEKRRFAPVPQRWMELSDRELTRLLGRATDAGQREGRLDTAKMRALTLDESTGQRV